MVRSSRLRAGVFFAACVIVPRVGHGADAFLEMLASAARGSDPGDPLRIDESLSRAARRHAMALIAGRGGPDLDSIRSALRVEGLADAQVLPFSADGTQAAVTRAAIDFAYRNARGRGLTHLGASSVVNKDAKTTLVVFFVRRLIDFAPLPTSCPARNVRMRGRAPNGIMAIRALMTNDQGEVEDIPVVRQGHHLTIDVPCERMRKQLGVEVVADTAFGPEAAILWRGPTTRQNPPQNIQPTPDDALVLLNGFRKQWGRTALTIDETLTQAAKAYAREVCARQIAVHVLDAKNTPHERARRAGYFGQVSENIAIAADLAQAEQDLEDSPSHRRALLDGTAKDVGLGVTVDGRMVCLVQLLGRREDASKSR